jgi:glucose-1-phosphate thymidylyltransferase
MIFYSLSTLLLAGVREIYISINRRDFDLYKRLLGDGSEFGCIFHYVFQDEALGIPHSIKLISSETQRSQLALMLGDNLFYGSKVGESLESGSNFGAQIFATQIVDPREFGVITLDDAGKPLSLEEKPSEPGSNLAVTGLYFFDSTVFERVTNLVPSPRGELEIVDLLKDYMKSDALRVTVLPRGTAWLDTGNSSALLKASQFVEAVEANQGLLVGSPHEVAWRKGWISREALGHIADKYLSSDYGRKLKMLLV